MSRYWAEIENKMDKIRLVQIWSGSGRQQVVVKVEQGDTWGGAEVPPLLHLPVGQLRWLSAPDLQY